MGSFFNPTTPPPPTDVPLVNIQTPNLKSAGEQLAAGAAEAGVFGQIGKVLVDGAADIAGQILSVFFNAYIWLGRFLVGIIVKAENRSDPAFGELAATAIEDIFGIQIQIGSVSGRGERSGRTIVAKNIGDAVLKGLFAGLGQTGSNVTAPSSAPAEAYLSSVTHMALENWLEGWMVEALSLGQLERFGDLGDAMARTWGLGRVTNRVIGPVAELLIGDPFKAKVNATYRPHLLSPAEACRQFTPGRWTRERLVSELSVQGYSDDRIEALINAQRQFLDVGELDHLVARQLWTRAQAVQHLQDQGLSKEAAEAKLAIAENRRLDTYRQQWVNEALTRFAARDIDSATWFSILDKSGLPERDRDMLRIVGGIRRELRTKQLTASEVEQAVKRSILNLDDYRKFLTAQGYNFADSLTLELLLLGDIKDAREADAARQRLERERQEAALRRAEEAAARRGEIERQLDSQQISLATFEQAVLAGVRSLAEYREFIAARGYAADDQATLAGLLAGKIEQRNADAARREELLREARVKRISLGDVEEAVKRGVATIEEYSRFLSDAGYAEADRALLVTVLEAELQQAAEAVRRREEAKAELARRDVSLDDVERAVRRGLRSMDDYRAFLDSIGFDAEERDLLASLLQAELDEDAAARSRKEEAARLAAVRKIDLADLERAVRAGLSTIADYRGALARAGFTANDLDTLTRLLQLDIESDQADAKTRQEARDRAAVRRINLDELERAVRLSVIPMSVYQAGLVRAGLPAEDQQILTLSLAAELRDVKAAQEAKARAASTLKARGLSLAQFERAVRDGLRSVTEYRLFLEREGFSPPDAATLGALLELEVAQAAAAVRRRAEIEAELGRKQLSLAQFERAVKGGVRRVDEYVAFLRSQGYSELDVGTLVTLLLLSFADASEV